MGDTADFHIPADMSEIACPGYRNAHFSGFAELVWNKINELDRADLAHFNMLWRQECLTIIARCAYDLVEHTLNNAPVTKCVADVEDIPDIEDIPDVLEWKLGEPEETPEHVKESTFTRTESFEEWE